MCGPVVHGHESKCLDWNGSMLQIGALLSGCNAKNLPNLRNLAMELRKVCCHPVRHAAQAAPHYLWSLATTVQTCMLHKLHLTTSDYSRHCCVNLHAAFAKCAATR
jgi:hypothetical protein